MRVDRRGQVPEVDLEPEHLDRRALQAVDSVLRRRRQPRRLDLQLSNFADPQRNHEKNQACEDDDDHDKHHHDCNNPWQADLDKTSDARLDQESDGGAEHEGAEKVAHQIEDDDRDGEGGKAEGDLQVAAAAFRVDRPRRDADSA